MMDPPKTVTTYVYRSHGELAPGEPWEAFDSLDSWQLDPTQSGFAGLEAQRQAMVARISSLRKTTNEFRGDAFIEKLDERVRKYSLIDQKKEVIRSPLRLFYAPALAFLAAAFGCAFISFRWK